MRAMIFFSTMILAVGALADSHQNAKAGVPTIVESGRRVFAENCAVCHGKNAEGLVKDWRKTLPDGNYPPPPLNGTAHAWHHSPKTLLMIIDEGGAPLGGKMPGFKDELSAAEKAAVLDYLFNLWPENIQRRYAEAFFKQ